MFRSVADESGAAVNAGVSSAAPGMESVTYATRRIRDEAAVIGQGLRIAGNLECEGHLVIAGIVEGKVKGRELIVTDDGIVKGKIDCEAVQVMGEVEGQISAVSVQVANTGLVVGDISYDALVVANGATIDGQLQLRRTGTG